MNEIDSITGEIIDAALKLHTRLGPGLLESVYEGLLAKELTRRGFVVERQQTIDVEIDDVRYHRGIRIDLLVNKLVVVEVKSIESLARVHTMQVVTYLRLMNLSVGLLINFGGATLREGLRRVVNNYQPAESSSLRIDQRPSNRIGADDPSAKEHPNQEQPPEAANETQPQGESAGELIQRE